MSEIFDNISSIKTVETQYCARDDGPCMSSTTDGGAHAECAAAEQTKGKASWRLPALDDDDLARLRRNYETCCYKAKKDYTDYAKKMKSDVRKPELEKACRFYKLDLANIDVDRVNLLILMTETELNMNYGTKTMRWDDDVKVVHNVQSGRIWMLGELRKTRDNLVNNGFDTWADFVGKKLFAEAKENMRRKQLEVLDETGPVGVYRRVTGLKAEIRRLEVDLALGAAVADQIELRKRQLVNAQIEGKKVARLDRIRRDELEAKRLSDKAARLAAKIAAIGARVPPVLAPTVLPVSTENESDSSSDSSYEETVVVRSGKCPGRKFGASEVKPDVEVADAMSRSRVTESFSLQDEYNVDDFVRIARIYENQIRSGFEMSQRLKIGAMLDLSNDDFEPLQQSVVTRTGYLPVLHAGQAVYHNALITFNLKNGDNPDASVPVASPTCMSYYKFASLHGVRPRATMSMNRIVSHYEVSAPIQTCFGSSENIITKNKFITTQLNGGVGANPLIWPELMRRVELSDTNDCHLRILYRLAVMYLASIQGTVLVDAGYAPLAPAAFGAAWAIGDFTQQLSWQQAQDFLIVNGTMLTTEQEIAVLYVAGSGLDLLTALATAGTQYVLDITICDTHTNFQNGYLMIRPGFGVANIAAHIADTSDLIAMTDIIAETIQKYVSAMGLLDEWKYSLHYVVWTASSMTRTTVSFPRPTHLRDTPSIFDPTMLGGSRDIKFHVQDTRANLTLLKLSYYAHKFHAALQTFLACLTFDRDVTAYNQAQMLQTIRRIYPDGMDVPLHRTVAVAVCVLNHIDPTAVVCCDALSTLDSMALSNMNLNILSVYGSYCLKAVMPNTYAKLAKKGLSVSNAGNAYSRVDRQPVEEYALMSAWGINVFSQNLYGIGFAYSRASNYEAQNTVWSGNYTNQLFRSASVPMKLVMMRMAPYNNPLVAAPQLFAGHAPAQIQRQIGAPPVPKEVKKPKVVVLDSDSSSDSEEEPMIIVRKGKNTGKKFGAGTPPRRRYVKKGGDASQQTAETATSVATKDGTATKKPAEVSGTEQTPKDGAVEEEKSFRTAHSQKGKRHNSRRRGRNASKREPSVANAERGAMPAGGSAKVWLQAHMVVLGSGGSQHDVLVNVWTTREDLERALREDVECEVEHRAEESVQEHLLSAEPTEVQEEARQSKRTVTFEEEKPQVSEPVRETFTPFLPAQNRRQLDIQEWAPRVEKKAAKMIFVTPRHVYQTLPHSRLEYQSLYGYITDSVIGNFYSTIEQRPGDDTFANEIHVNLLVTHKLLDEEAKQKYLSSEPSGRECTDEPCSGRRDRQLNYTSQSSSGNESDSYPPAVSTETPLGSVHNAMSRCNSDIEQVRELIAAETGSRDQVTIVDIHTSGYCGHGAVALLARTSVEDVIERCRAKGRSVEPQTDVQTLASIVQAMYRSMPKKVRIFVPDGECVVQGSTKHGYCGTAYIVGHKNHWYVAYDDAVAEMVGYHHDTCITPHRTSIMSTAVQAATGALLFAGHFTVANNYLNKLVRNKGRTSDSTMNNVNALRIKCTDNHSKQGVAALTKSPSAKCCSWETVAEGGVLSAGEVDSDSDDPDGHHIMTERIAAINKLNVQNDWYEFANSTAKQKTNIDVSTFCRKVVKSMCVHVRAVCKVALKWGLGASNHHMCAVLCFVCATTLSPSAAIALYKSGFPKTRPTRWIDHFSAVHDEVRVHSTLGEYVVDNFQDQSQLMYVHSLYGRMGEEADWDDEKRKRSVQCNAKYSVNWRTGELSEKKFDTMLERNIHKLLLPAYADARKETFTAYITTMYKNLASGSVAFPEQRVKEKVMAAWVDDKDRDAVGYTLINKRSYLLGHSVKEIYSWLKTKPKCAAKAHTKSDEYAKKRALYAVSVRHYLIMSYLINDLEVKVKDERYVQQEGGGGTFNMARSIADLCMKYKHMNSYDFSDFNAQHSTKHMKMVFETLRRMVYRDPTLPPAEKSDLLAAYTWVIESYDNATITFPDDTVLKVVSGLFSGDRATSFINTVLNICYTQTVTQAYTNTQPEMCPVKSWHCGDDVLMAFESDEASQMFTYAMQVSGFVANPKKQLLQCGRAEFLRVMYYPDGTAKAALNRSIVGTVCGTWETAVSDDPVARVHAIYDQLMMLMRRGARSDTCAKLHVELAKYFCTVRREVKNHNATQAEFEAIEFYRKLSVNNGGMGLLYPKESITSISGNVQVLRSIKTAAQNVPADTQEVTRLSVINLDAAIPKDNYARKYANKICDDYSSAFSVASAGGKDVLEKWRAVQAKLRTAVYRRVLGAILKGTNIRDKKRFVRSIERVKELYVMYTTAKKRGHVMQGSQLNAHLTMPASLDRVGEIQNILTERATSIGKYIEMLFFSSCQKGADADAMEKQIVAYAKASGLYGVTFNAKKPMKIHVPYDKSTDALVSNELSALLCANLASVGCAPIFDNGIRKLYLSQRAMPYDIMA